MKKIILSAILSLAATQAFAGTDGPGNSTLSATLQCQEGACRDVEAPVNSNSWCPRDQEGSQPLSGIYKTAGMKLDLDGKTLISIDADGDQFKMVTFNLEKVKNAKVGEELTGTYSDGFWYSDGDHFRYTIDLNCIKLK